MDEKTIYVAERGSFRKLKEQASEPIFVDYEISSIDPAEVMSAIKDAMK